MVENAKTQIKNIQIIWTYLNNKAKKSIKIAPFLIFFSGLAESLNILSLKPLIENLAENSTNSNIN